MNEKQDGTTNEQQRRRYRSPQQPPRTVPVDASGDERPLTPAVTEKEPPVSPPTSPTREPRVLADRVVARLVQVVDYLFYVLYGLLSIRFLLGLVGAREDAGFVRFIDRLTDPFYEPFAGIVARPAADGGVIDLPLLIALAAYFVLHLAVRGMLRLFMSRSHTTVIHRR